MREQNVVILAGLVLLSGVASGQDALGDGRALDNSLSTQTKYNYQRPNLADELRFRNAIATGNAPGGLSFRGDVGYRAPGEFTGQLGSDDLFAFRRDSMYSGLAGMGIRGTEALQFQFALSTGGMPPQGILGSMTYGRGQEGLAGGVGRPGAGMQDPTIVRAPTDFGESGTLMWGLRSPSAYEVNRGYQSVLLATERLETGEEVGLTASELRGVRRVELSSGPEGFDARQETPVGALPVNRIETSYLALMERLKAESEAAGAAPAEAGVMPEWQQRLMELREQLYLTPTPVVDPEEGVEVKPRVEAGPFRASPETVERLLRATAPAPVSDFVQAETQGAFAEHMRVGQELLGAGRYFDAEERFAHALTVRPGDVTAQIGRMHAQIGAAMYLSAALNMRQLFLSFPEMVATRYEAGLLPTAARIVEVREQLEGYAGRIDGQKPSIRDIRLARASGVLLAYLGFQTRDEALVQRGLEWTRKAVGTSIESEPTEEDLRDQRLLDFLEQMWVESAGG